MNNYAEQKKTEISKIEDIIKQYCPKEEGLQKIIFEAILNSFAGIKYPSIEANISE